MSHTLASRSGPRARPKPFTFFPPKNNRLVIRVVQSLIPFDMRRKLRVSDIQIDQEGLQRLEMLKGQRCLLAPSHSGGFEPHVLMHLSRLLKDQFNYVAAIELFIQSPLHRWLLPRLGVYSIIRGAVDRPSFSMTRQLLAAGDRWLVIFPEGETIWQNDLVMPFQQGVFQLAFKAYEDALKSDHDAHLYCVPIAIKYVYTQEMHAAIDASLARLEPALSIPPAVVPLSRYDRLRRVGEAVLAANERAQGVQLTPGVGLNDRIQFLKEHVVSQLEGRLHVAPTERQTLLDRIRTLFNTVDRIAQEEPAGSAYERQLSAERQEIARGLYHDLWRVLQFVAIHDGYVRESMTFERFLDVLGLLEREVLGRREFCGPRKAMVQVGEPVDLSDWYAAYASDKRNAIRDVTLTLENSVHQMLDVLGRGCKPVEDNAAEA